MNKQELVNQISQQTEVSKKDIELVLKAFENVTTDALKKDDKIQLVGFMTIESGIRNARIGRNPKTNEEIEIPGGRYPKVKFGKTIKDAIK